MEWNLDPVEIRILGCLIEKQATTPESYPLTLNSLVAACNQTTNRDPVVSYDASTVERGLESLRTKGLIWAVRGGRAMKYDQRLRERLPLDAAGMATLCVLMLRGPQTAGEIRGRTGRQHAFAGLEEAEATLDALSRHDPPLVTRLPRQPGTSAVRFAHRLGSDAPEAEADSSTPHESRADARGSRPAGEEWLPEFDQEMATTRRLLERVPGDKADWKPHQKSFSMAHLAQLVARMPGWITSMLRTTVLDLSGAPAYSNEATETLVAEFDRNVQEARTALASARDEDLDVAWSLQAGDRVLMSMPRRTVLRQTINHLVHHRGQLSVYLRLVDVPLPSIYGPTADERW